VRPRALVALALIATLAFVVWRAQLFTVSRPGEKPVPLAVRPAADRASAALDIVLPVVPVGMQRLHADGSVRIIHYWAPWERHGAPQAHGLDSLLRDPAVEGVQGVMVCFDPFPSVARYVARQRLRVPVLLDTHRGLRRALPCPSVPYTYVIDRTGRIAVEQAGEVDWEAEETRRVLRGLLEETAEVPAVPPGVS
jgi:hypothetical protein